MLMIIFVKYVKNPSRTVRAVKQILKHVPNFRSFIAKSWLNDLEDICEGQGHMALLTHWPLENLRKLQVIF